jgi:hypothetical protein
MFSSIYCLKNNFDNLQFSSFKSAGNFKNLKLPQILIKERRHCEEARRSNLRFLGGCFVTRNDNLIKIGSPLIFIKKLLKPCRLLSRASSQ